ncbi:hypothetical protein PG990_009053 [Apiospora arundinis]
MSLCTGGSGQEPSDDDLNSNNNENNNNNSKNEPVAFEEGVRTRKRVRRAVDGDQTDEADTAVVPDSPQSSEYASDLTPPFSDDSGLGDSPLFPNLVTAVTNNDDTHNYSDDSDINEEVDREPPADDGYETWGSISPLRLPSPLMSLRGDSDSDPSSEIDPTTAFLSPPEPEEESDGEPEREIRDESEGEPAGDPEVHVKCDCARARGCRVHVTKAGQV